MLARVARSASLTAAKRALPLVLAARQVVPVACVSQLQIREKSSLASLLQREIAEEKGNCFEGEELEELHALMDKVFTLKETPGNMEVVLEGSVAGDSVRVKFDAQDVIELEDEYDGDEEENDEAEYDEEESEEEEEDELPGIRFVADVTRDNQGLQFECVASSNVTIERVRFLKDFAAAKDDESRYFGPNFIDLELDVQEKLYEYLADRKVDDNLAQFITQYADLKEQREYLSFLEDATKFVKN